MNTRTDNFLPGFKQLGEREFGGGLLRKGNPREARPLSTKFPMHLVLRSSMAKGEKSFLHPSRAQRIEKMVRRLGKQQGVRVLRYSNGGHHLHMLVLPRSRKAFHNFVRSISGVAARLSLGRERGKATPLSVSKNFKSDQNTHKHFWDARPFTRIVKWGREFAVIARGLERKTDEVFTFWPRVKFSSA